VVDNFAKVYESLLDSTLFYTHGKDPCWLFVVMLLKSDKDGYIRIADRGIAQKAGITAEEFDKLIEILKSPDPDSNLGKCEGRRVISLRDLPKEKENRGYLVVNKDHYRDKGSSTKRVQALRRRQEIYKLFSELLGVECNDEFHKRYETAVYVYVSVYVSDISIKYINECCVDFNLWATYEDYRKKVLKKPLKSDDGRTRQLNTLKNLSQAEQQKIIKNTIENEWVKLVPLEKTKTNGKDEDTLIVIGNRLGIILKPGEQLFAYHNRVRARQEEIREQRAMQEEINEEARKIANDKEIKKLIEEKRREKGK